MKFKIGDIVYDKRSGNIGKVITLNQNSNQVGIDFGKGFRGHDLDGKIKTRTGWFCFMGTIKKHKKTNIEKY